MQDIPDPTALPIQEYYPISRENANKQAHIDNVDAVKAGVDGKLLYNSRNNLSSAFTTSGAMIRQTRYINQYFIHVDIVMKL